MKVGVVLVLGAVLFVAFCSGLLSVSVPHSPELVRGPTPDFGIGMIAGIVITAGVFALNRMFNG